jgi:hypothetical protein
VLVEPSMRSRTGEFARMRVMSQKMVERRPEAVYAGHCGWRRS